MGNEPSKGGGRHGDRDPRVDAAVASIEAAADRVNKTISSSMKRGRRPGGRSPEDSSFFIDSVCNTLFTPDDDHHHRRRGHKGRGGSFGDSYSDGSSVDSRTVDEDEDTIDDSTRGGSYEDDSRRRSSHHKRSSRSRKKVEKADSESLVSNSMTDDYSKDKPEKSSIMSSSSDGPVLKPLASSFAKRCYFTKSGIGKTTQHYEGLTLTGNVVLMLAQAMKLKGCPTICDEDLRRVEQTYPNQFSRLPDELLLSSGWRRISKYCHFSNKAIPDGIPFFHSKKRVHPQGGYYFLLAAAVGMVRPIDVEPLTRDTLIVLETDFAAACDAASPELIEDPTQWTLVNQFCFFSGGPINTEEDVYYKADFDGNFIYMLAFLSPSLTPEELYRLNGEDLKSTQAVEEVESIYDLTERDFDDLKLYHLGPCRALPPYILTPHAWTKVLPPHFLAARAQALDKAQQYEALHPEVNQAPAGMAQAPYPPQAPPGQGFSPNGYPQQQQFAPPPPGSTHSGDAASQMRREAEEEGAFMQQDQPMDEAIATRASQLGASHSYSSQKSAAQRSRMDPEGEEPPSLSVIDPNDPVGHVASSMPGKPPLQNNNRQHPMSHGGSQGSHQGSAPMPSDDRGYYEEEGDYPPDEYDDGYGPPPPPHGYYDDYGPPPPHYGGGGGYYSQGGGPEEYFEGDEYLPEDGYHPDDHMYGHHQHHGDDGFVPIDEGGEYKDYGPDDGVRADGTTSDITQSSAMKGAQELLRKNRQKRIADMASRRAGALGLTTSPESHGSPRGSVTSPMSGDQGSDVGSDVSSTVSSEWTENTNPADRSSRRALILQMAKARMNKQNGSPDAGDKKKPESEPTNISTENIDFSGDLD